MYDQFLYIGFAFAAASALLFNFRLYQLNRYLESAHPEIWMKYGSGNKNLHRLAQYYKLRMLVSDGVEPDYEVTPELADRLRMLAWLQRSTVVGLIIICGTATIDLLGP